MRTLSEVAELAGLHPLQYQFEEPWADASAALEGVPQGTDGEQDQPYHRSKGNHHQTVRPRALQAEQVREAYRCYPPEDQHGPQDPGDTLLRGDKARPPGVAQPSDLVAAFGVELFFGPRVRLEPLYARPDVVDEVPPRLGPRFLLQSGLVALRHQGPLLMDHLLGVGSGELLDVGALGLGQLIAKPEDLGHRVSLLLDRLACGLVFLPHGDDHECEKHGVDHAQSCVDEARNVVVSLARLGGNEAMHQLEPYE